MNDPIVLPEDLQLLLGDSTLDVERAAFVLGIAQDLCESVVSPLPDAARGVVLGVAVRAFSNPASVHSVGVGTGSVAFGSSATSGGIGGIYLSRSDITTLRRLAGVGGAYTIDPTPVDAGANLPVWSQNVTWPNGIPTVDNFQP